MEREDQRVEAGMVHRDESEEIVDLSLVPSGRRDLRRCRHVPAGVGRQHDVLAQQGSVLRQDVAKPGLAVLGHGEETSEPGSFGDVCRDAPNDCFLACEVQVLLGGHRGTPNSLAAWSRRWLSCAGGWTPRITRATMPSAMATTIKLLTSPLGGVGTTAPSCSGHVGSQHGLGGEP